MKINKYVVLAILLVSLLTISVGSQIADLSPDDKFKQTTQLTKINDKIGLQEKQDCKIAYYNATEDIYGYIPRTRNVRGQCFNPANQSNYTCITGTEDYQSYEVIGNQIVLRNNTDCKSTSFVISITKGSVTEKKEIDFSDWGACIYSEENGCLVVTCVSHDDGAFNGQFTDCKGGKSCQRFEICDGNIRTFYKNSRKDFVENDPTFYHGKLPLKEVE